MENRSSDLCRGVDILFTLLVTPWYAEEWLNGSLWLSDMFMQTRTITLVLYWRFLFKLFFEDLLIKKKSISRPVLRVVTSDVPSQRWARNLDVRWETSVLRKQENTIRTIHLSPHRDPLRVQSTIERVSHRRLARVRLQLCLTVFHCSVNSLLGDIKVQNERISNTKMKTSSKKMTEFCWWFV